MAKVIMSTNGYEILVSDEDFDQLSKYKWSASRSGGTNTRYAIMTNKRMSMHRFIMNPTSEQLIDHANQITLDNRRENLRICNKKQNAQNSKIRNDNTSSYRGVSWRKDRNKWRAYIVVDQKQIALGHYGTKEEAAKVFNQAATLYFGDFAYLNTIEQEK